MATRRQVAAVALVAGAMVLVVLARAALGEVRPAPLRDLPAGTVLRAADFGATPDDGRDDRPAIQAAIDAARGREGPVRVVLGPGRFDLHAAGDALSILQIVHQRDLVLDGGGADLVVHDPTKGLLTVAVSRRVIVRNLSVDYDPLPMTQGWMRAVDAERRAFDVEIAEGFALPDGEPFVSAQVKWGIFKDRSRPRALKPGSHNMCPLEAWRKVGPRRFRYRTAAWYPMDTVESGDAFVHLARVNTAPVVGFWKSEDVTVAGVRVFASPGAGFVAQLCSRLNLLDVHVAPADGRWQCLAADGFYCISNRTGPWIENCVFDATGDDAIVLKGWGANGVAKPDACTLVLAPRPTYEEGTHVFAVRAGDTIRVCDPTRSALLAEFRIAAAEQVERGKGRPPAWRVTADRDLDAIAPGADRRDPIFYNDDTMSGHFVVRGNTLRNVRRWGLVCMSHHGVIEGNTVERTSAQAVLFTSNDAGFRDSDGFVARDVAVRRNRFVDCYTQRPAEYAGVAATVTSVVIAGVERTYQADVVDWRGHAGLAIEGNRFVGRGTRPAISLGNVRGARVRDNVFEVRRGGLDGPQDTRAAPRIRVRAASDVEITGNEFAGARAGRMLAVEKATTERVRVHEPE